LEDFSEDCVTSCELLGYYKTDVAVIATIRCSAKWLPWPVHCGIEMFTPQGPSRAQQDECPLGMVKCPFRALVVSRRNCAGMT
jgi:hypothetical protein